eukprot:364668-Chlamydomonas_euryale.AAC.3
MNGVGKISSVSSARAAQERLELRRPGGFGLPPARPRRWTLTFPLYTEGNRTVDGANTGAVIVELKAKAGERDTHTERPASMFGHA